jgi:BirA family biotin operon repressor/biotin-[acetyl-CoA-carboxylase] ligase
LNIDWPRPGEYPGATSLVARGAAVRRDALLHAMLERVDVDASDLRDRYIARSATIGTEVRVELPGGESVEGRAVDIDDTGRLVLVDGQNRRSVYAAGDVTHLR